MSYFTWDMKSEVLDDYAAQGKCSNCYMTLDYKEGCPDCDDTCQKCDEYMWQFDESTWKTVDDEPMCQDCWLEN